MRGVSGDLVETPQMSQILSLVLFFKWPLQDT